MFANSKNTECKKTRFVDVITTNRNQTWCYANTTCVRRRSRHYFQQNNKLFLTSYGSCYCHFPDLNTDDINILRKISHLSGFSNIDFLAHSHDDTGIFPDFDKIKTNLHHFIGYNLFIWYTNIDLHGYRQIHIWKDRQHRSYNPWWLIPIPYTIWLWKCRFPMNLNCRRILPAGKMIIMFHFVQ